MKFGRSYQMTIAGNYGNNFTGPTSPIVISFPTTLELNITHNIFASANVADFSLYGLSATNRSLISFNQFLKPKPYPITLYAGYLSQQSSGLLGAPSSLPIIFNGFANIAYTERNGVELVTRINAFDNGDATTGQPAGYFGPQNSYTAPAGTSFIVMVKQVMSRLTGGVKVGSVLIDPSQAPANLSRPKTFTGNVWSNLQDLARWVKGGGAHVYIENNVCNMLGQNQTQSVTNSLGVLQSSTGLLGIPRYTGPNIMVSCVFEPSLTIGAQIELKSTFNQQSNGLCKIIAYTHRGSISGVESGELVSDITLMKIDTPVGAIQE